MKFSWVPGFTTGSDVLAGCLGIARAESYSLDRLIAEWDRKDHPILTGLSKTSLRITAHYHTEPPQVNFVSVTSFFNPINPSDELPQGGILGLDVLRPTEAYDCHPLVPEVRFRGRVVPVHDLSPVLSITRSYLERFPFYPGCQVFEANQEISTFDCDMAEWILARQGKAVRLYAVLAIGVPEGSACRLLMEDRGHFVDDEQQEGRKQVLGRAAQSILACQEVEQARGVQVEYQHVYLLSTFSDPLIDDGQMRFQLNRDRGWGFVPAWSQVQFIYASPPRELIPPGRSIDDLREMPFQNWLAEQPT